MRSAELAIIILYPTSASGITVLLKTTTDDNFLYLADLVIFFLLMHTLTIVVGHGIMGHIPRALTNQNPGTLLSNESVFNNVFFYLTALPNFG